MCYIKERKIFCKTNHLKSSRLDFKWETNLRLIFGERFQEQIVWRMSTKEQVIRHDSDFFLEF